MKWFDKVTKKLAKTASNAVKEEVVDTALELLPTVVGVVGFVVGCVLIKSGIDHSMANSGVITSGEQLLPTHSNITITTNNYYYGSDLVAKLLEENNNE